MILGLVLFYVLTGIGCVPLFAGLEEKPNDWWHVLTWPCMLVKLLYTKDMESKRCRFCGETKPVEEFSRRPDSRDGYGNRCASCKAEWVAP